jgi:hypothetical protein
MISLLLALTLMTAAPPPDDGAGEPLPPGAPTDPYELSAWCYGALGEYLTIYDKVKPDLRDIDKLFGSSVVEAEPYQSDMAAYRVELKLIGDSVTEAEKASPDRISDRGVSAMRRGREIWSLAEAKSNRELARAWLGWALPDRCDANARELATRSIVLGKALRYNEGDKTAPPSTTPDMAPPMSGHASPPPADTISAAFATPIQSGPPAQAAASAPSETSPPVAIKSEPPPAVLETAPPAVQAEAAAPSEPPTKPPPADAIASEPPLTESSAQASVATTAPDATDTRTGARATIDAPPPGAAGQTTSPPASAAAASGATGVDEPQEPTL